MLTKKKIIERQEPVTLTFACRYLNMFTKASCLAPEVSLTMSPGVPLMVEYSMDRLGIFESKIEVQ